MTDKEPPSPVLGRNVGYSWRHMKPCGFFGWFV